MYQQLLCTVICSTNTLSLVSVDGALKESTFNKNITATVQCIQHYWRAKGPAMQGLFAARAFLTSRTSLPQKKALAQKYFLLSFNAHHTLWGRLTSYNVAPVGSAVVQVVCSLQRVLYRLSHFFIVVYTCVQQMEFQAQSPWNYSG